MRTFVGIASDLVATFFAGFEILTTGWRILLSVLLLQQLLLRYRLLRRYLRIRCSISSNGYNGIAIRTISLLADSGSWKLFLEGAMRASEVDIRHDLLL